MESGATVRTAFCGPCFGAGDVPANNGLSIRHSTRNFPNREGSKVTEWSDCICGTDGCAFDRGNCSKQRISDRSDRYRCRFYKAEILSLISSIYENRVFDSKGVADPSVEIQFGPNIKDWPAMCALTDNLILQSRHPRFTIR